MVESTALEMRHTGNRIGGSNPSLSARLKDVLSTTALGIRFIDHLAEAATAGSPPRGAAEQIGIRPVKDMLVDLLSMRSADVAGHGTRCP